MAGLSRPLAAYQAMAEGPDAPSTTAKNETDPLVRSALYLGIALGLLRQCAIDVRGDYDLSLISDEEP